MSKPPSIVTPLDLFVYAPLGAVARVRKELPRLAAEGRGVAAGPGAMYRSIGELAVGQLKTRAEGRAGDLHRLLAAVGLVDAPGEAAPDDETGAGAPTASPTPSTGTPTKTPTESSPLPIPDYDDLQAARIVPLLAGLTPQEQDLIRNHEQAHRGRRTILGRLDALADRREGPDPAAAEGAR